MNKKQKKNLYRIIAALVLVLILKLLPQFPTPVELLLYCIPYLVVGWDVLRKALLGIKNRQPFDECFLMAVATVGAFALGDYVEGCAVIIFYQIGELFQSVAVGKSRQSIASLMDIRPDYANIEGEDGKLEQVDPDEVEVGTVIVVQPGERVPIDGVIVEGASALNTAALTGESLPRDVNAGDEVISGCVNMTGLLKVRTTKEFGESTVSKILDLVENSSMKKARAENFITRFARVYTPAVCYGALALALLPPVVLLLMGQPARFGDWVYRALTFLVISCPCALVISIPLSFFGGIGGASACGILIKGSTYLEELANTGVVVFDKTGTLTQGTFKVTGIHPAEGVTDAALVEAAALAESWSKHPISLSIKAAYGKPIDAARVTDVQELGGHGVTAKVDGKAVAAGNARLMEKLGLTVPAVDGVGTIVHVAVEGSYAGYLLISDVVKPHSADAIRAVKASGVRKTVMLTGDAQPVAQAVAQQLGLDEYHAGLLPGDKVDQIEKLLAEKQPKENLAFVGDGINDAPVLSRADVGIAMGALGSDAAIEAADVVLTDDNLATLVDAVEQGRCVYANIRKFVRYLLSCNIGEVLTMFLGILMGMPVVLLPTQLLLVNLVTDGLPAIALGLEPPEPEAMQKPPRKPDESFFSDGLMGRIFFRGILIGICTLGAFSAVVRTGGTLEAARTAALCTLILSQLVHVFECKSERRTLFSMPYGNNLWLVGAVLVSVAVLAAAVAVPMLRVIFSTVMLTRPQWYIALGFSLTVPLCSSIAGLFRRKKQD